MNAVGAAPQSAEQKDAEEMHRVQETVVEFEKETNVKSYPTQL